MVRPNLRGQAYDGAGNMAGSVDGTAALIAGLFANPLFPAWRAFVMMVHAHGLRMHLLMLGACRYLSISTTDFLSTLAITNAFPKYL